VGGQDNVLAAVAGSSARDVWAVGQFAPDANPNITNALSLHFDGSAWTVVPVPPPGPRASALLGVATSGGRAWAVGYYLDESFRVRSLIEAWDGSSWSVVPHPNPGQPDLLFGVAAASATEVWAAGYFRDSEGRFHTLLERYDGSSWSLLPSPDPGSVGNQLWGVAASPGHVWVAGQRVDGQGPDRALLAHLDLSRGWTVDGLADASGSAQLYGVAAPAGGAVVAVGDLQSDAAPARVLAAGLSGGPLQRLTAADPSPGDEHLYAVAAGRTGSWAVGSVADPSTGHLLTLVERGGAAGFAQVPSSSPAFATGGDSLLGGVGAVGDQVWAVGTFDGPNAKATLILRSSCR
jgi:hypothetical protein